MPLISVIMPSYNHGRFIREAIDSVLGQTVDDLELIVIDDASRDDSRSVIESCRAADGRVRSLYNEVNQGIARTLNRGLDEARGTFVAFLASDDVWLKDKLRKQLEVLRGNEDVVVCSGMLAIDAEGRCGGEAKCTRSPFQGLVPREQLLAKLLKGNFIAGQSLIVKRGNFDGIRYDERLRYLNDWKIAVDLAVRCDYYFMPECLVQYRLHGGNTISRDALGWLDDYGKIGQYILENYGARVPRETRAMFMYRIGCRQHWQGDRSGGRQWMVKAIAAHPFKSEYYTGILASFGRNPVIPRALRRRIPSGS